MTVRIIWMTRPSAIHNCWAMTFSCRYWPLNWVFRWHGVSFSLFETHAYSIIENLIMILSYSRWLSESPRQCGLTKSGLSIRGAINLLQSIAYIKTPSITINVGSIDILHGRDLVDMRLDYEELVNICVTRNIQPIITTLAPLANTSQYHSRDMRDKLILFNNYLRDHYYPKYAVINIWSQLVTPRGRTLFQYFESYVETARRLYPLLFVAIGCIFHENIFPPFQRIRLRDRQ